MTHRDMRIAATLLVAGLGLSGAAWAAAPLRAETLKYLTPSERRAAFDAARAVRSSATQATVAQDDQPPALVAISVARATTVTPDGQQALVHLQLSDDWSGLDWGHFRVLCADTGALREVDIPEGFGARRQSVDVAVQLPASEPACTWRVDELFGADANGNPYHYDAVALAAFGDLGFKVKPVPGGDWLPPRLVSGVIQTPSVWLDRPAKGTEGHAPMARVELNVMDPSEKGQSITSGVRAAEVEFCTRPPSSQCFVLRSADDVLPYGQARGRLIAGQAGMDPSLDAGDYELQTVWLADWSGQQTTYRKEDADFGSLFGNTVIRLRKGS